MFRELRTLAALGTKVPGLHAKLVKEVAESKIDRMNYAEAAREVAELQKNLLLLRDSGSKKQAMLDTKDRELGKIRQELAMIRASPHCSYVNGAGAVEDTRAQGQLDRLRDFRDGLIGHVNLPVGNLPGEPPTFPAYIEVADIFASWNAFQNTLVELMGEHKDIRVPTQMEPYKVVSGFRTFVHKLFGETRKLPMHREIWIQMLDEVTFPAVIVAYVADSLCERVFDESDIHNFDKSENRLLQKYRQVLSLIIGTAIQTVDSAATKLLITENHFNEEILMEEAKAIGDKLNEEVTPLFRNALGGDNEKSGRSQTAFQSCAQDLLKLKMDLLLVAANYDVYRVNAGADFDPARMEAKDRHGRTVTEELDHGAAVQFCIAPGLSPFDPEPLTLETIEKDYAAALLCSKTFFPGKEVVRNNVQIVAKALVLVE